ncbi:hypothetical protein DHEL01_v211285 [Diaporthe helianthi]|uniref:NADP-dependent oxidoreductase domain-containing protein n=1 Tax=Diaporthe helianthi TaxID=158607 RepID=A0A2P5HJA3_DIAHE|nr:hypothetical protein DHEL01_v211285 [Diaporthe helianthi]
MPAAFGGWFPVQKYARKYNHGKPVGRHELINPYQGPRALIDRDDLVWWADLPEDYGDRGNYICDADDEDCKFPCKLAFCSGINMAPQLIFGTATFGMDMTEFQSAAEVEGILKTLKSHGITRLDTAPRYPPLKPGEAEKLLGAAAGLSSDFTIDTKVYTNTNTDGSGYLSSVAIEKSISGSLEKLKRPQGWGVSNTPPAMLENILKLCDENGWQKPSSYQGDYNLVARAMETKPLPILRANNMKFVAFRSLAAGFLTGNSVNNKSEGTRMSEDNPLGKAMQRVFSGDELHQAMRKFDTGVRALGLSSIEVAIRWAAHNSALRDDDSIILGASKVKQLEETVGFIRRGPLAPEVIDLTNELWAVAQLSRGDVI